MSQRGYESGSKLNMLNTDLGSYYAKRATEYDAIYAKPERQADLAVLTAKVRALLSGHHVLEIACGTGYWTAQFAPVAASVLATDINPEVIEIARAKNLPDGKVRFALADAFAPPPDSQFTACFAGFWWSHVKREEQEAFVDRLRGVLGKDVLLVLIDNSYVEGSSTPVARTDAQGNTYQIRTLASGERFEIVKNFATDSALRKKPGAALRDVRILRLQHFWMLSGKLK